MSWGSLKRPGSRLSDPTPPPTASTKLPSLDSFTMRLLPPLWPSATQMSPSGDMATPDGPLKCVSSSPCTPASPMRITTSP